MQRSVGEPSLGAWGPLERSGLLVAVALVLWAGCGPRGAPVELELLTHSCEGPAPLGGVTWLRFRITGEGLVPSERYAPVEQGAAGLAEVPEGRGRVIEVRGYTALPGAGGQVVSLGRSRPFDVPLATQARRLVVRVALRRVGAFVSLASTGEPSQCLALGEPRAAHTATLLEDGRVLLAGGFRRGIDSGLATLATTELVDPVTGTREPGPRLDSPRAYHTATLLPAGPVLLAGGELVGATDSSPLGSAEVLDLAQRASTRVVLQAARSRHAAALESSGHVLLVGGVGSTGSPLARPEGYDVSTGLTLTVDTLVPRLGVVAAPVEGGRLIAVVGGTDGAALQGQVLLFAFEGGTFVPSGAGPKLREPRRDAALVPWTGGGQLLLVGGARDPDATEFPTNALASTELLTTEGTPGVGSGPVVLARAQPCAVALPEGQVLVAGGADERGPRGEVELLLLGQGRAPVALGLQPLARRRRLHTCTALPDGSVLLAGGLDDGSLPRSTLGDVRVLVPPPLD